MARSRIKRSYEVDADIIEVFDAWTRRKGLQKNAAAQLALWVVMRLSGAVRDRCLDEMDARPVSWADALSAERDDIAQAVGQAAEKALEETLGEPEVPPRKEAASPAKPAKPA